MLQVVNDTPFTTNLVVLPDPNGIDCAILAIKATCEISSEGVRLAEQQEPVIEVDEYWGDTSSSSLKYASEISLPKPSTDIVLIGHAYSEGGKPSQAMYVSLTVGTIKQTALIIGNRYIRNSTISTPEPFSRLPLVYEHAFGGTFVHPDDPSRVEYEPRNPVGIGFLPSWVEDHADSINKEPIRLPNIEDPNQPMRDLKDRPAPVGFGYVNAWWEPRKSYAGTYDEAWKKERAPFLPEDFDPRFLCCAHSGLVAPTYLSGGEQVTIHNGSPRGVETFSLPQIVLEVMFEIGIDEMFVEPSLDTIILEPDEHRLSMIFRASVSCDKQMLNIQDIRVRCIYSDVALLERRPV